MPDEWWIWKDLEGNDLSWSEYYPIFLGGGGAVETIKKALNTVDVPTEIGTQ
jgi:hypothetical protein